MSAEEAIRQMVDDWLAATRQGGEAGAEGYASFATENAVFLPPNSERLEGRSAIREAILGMTTLDGFDMTWNVTHIDVASDGKHAQIMGEFKFTARDPEGDPVADRGKYFDALEKQADGTWLCSVACWNSSLPLG